MELLKSFLTGLFFSICVGGIFNLFIGIDFFISNKKNYNEYTWGSLKVPTYLLSSAAVIGIVIQFVLGGF